jgi:hypothetical protein
MALSSDAKQKLDLSTEITNHISRIITDVTALSTPWVEHNAATGSIGWGPQESRRKFN